MKNTILGFPGDWMVTPEILEAAKLSLPMIREFYDKQGEVECFKTPFRQIVSEPLKGEEIYSVPFLSEAYCKLLLDEVRDNPSFQPNPDEDELRQIPEIIMDRHLPSAYTALASVVDRVIRPLIWELWGTLTNYTHIQIANYNLRDKRQGAWHHDQSADITIVVPLNTGNYSGGGTEFWGRGIVDPLPTGHALIFPSLTHMHRGLPVSSGDRFLLVFWLKARHGQE